MRRLGAATLPPNEPQRVIGRQFDLCAQLFAFPVQHPVQPLGIFVGCVVEPEIPDL